MPDQAKKSIKNRVAKKVKRYSRFCVNEIAAVFRRIAFCRGSIQPNKVFFMTYDGKYACNPKYIADELIRRKVPVELVWAISKNETDLASYPPEVRLVRRQSKEMYREMASSKVWIDNALNCVWDNMPKKKDQVYINTWHGSMGVKRLRGNKMWMFRARRCKKRTDYCVTNSRFEENVFRETFWPNTPFLRVGHPRNDLLFAPEEQHRLIREKVASRFQLKPGQRILLYAPTFRDDGDLSCYNIKYSKLKSSLEERFGGDWIVLIRAHFKNRRSFQCAFVYDWIKDASQYQDMQELMIAADAGITDYSSWAYDYVLMKKPMFLYVPDSEKYNNERGLYFPLESTPFPIAHTTDELVEKIAQFNEEHYRERIKGFLDEKGCYEIGEASAKIVELIWELIRRENENEKKERKN